VGWIDDIGPGNVGIDTAVFIYFIEEAPRYLPTLVPLFQDADAGRRELIASAVTLLEVLVVPYRAGNHASAERYEALLTQSRGVRLIDITSDQLRRAAQIRAATGARTPDALQVAAAQAARCAVFITNDRRLPTVPGLRIIQLAAYAA
jgi:predicted nucleic acid-binding protein